MKKVIIIGAGISGMSAGVYAQRNGYETEIFEKHSISGGECTGWRRGNYQFDGCIHWLMGAKKGDPLNDIWRRVGALDDTVDIYNAEYFGKYELDGKELVLYFDTQRLEKHLLELSPQDSKEIKAMCKAINGFKGMSIPADKPFDMMKLGDIVKLMLSMMKYRGVMKYGKLSLAEYAGRFQSPLIRCALTGLMADGYAAMSFLSTIASLSEQESGWPAGGSRAMAKRIEDRYRSLGGKIRFNSPVECVLTENGIAKGIRLADGSEVFADHVIAATDGHEALFHLLDGEYLTDLHKEMYSENKHALLPSSFQVWAGVNADLSGEAEMMDFELSKPLIAGGKTYNRINIKNYCYDKSMAPEGCSVLTSFFYIKDFDNWQRLYENKAAYKAEKDRIAAEVKQIIEERYPAARGKIEQMDVATPMTYVRYCNAWRGSWMSWIKTPGLKVQAMPMKLNGLKNFVMAGQWIMPPGGLPVAVISGKWAVQHL